MRYGKDTQNKTLLSGYLRLIKTICIELPIHFNIIIMTTLLLAIPGGMEWVLIAVVVLLLFGGKKNSRINERARQRN